MDGNLTLSLVGVVEGARRFASSELIARGPHTRLARQQAAKPSLSLPRGERGAVAL
jgi:hypothetical protein